MLEGKKYKENKQGVTFPLPDYCSRVLLVGISGNF